MGFENSRVPSLQFRELAPWGHRKDARHIPAYPCSAGSRWPVFSTVGGKRNRISSDLCDLSELKTEMMMKHDKNGGPRPGFSTSSNPWHIGYDDMHILATARGLILHPIFTSAEIEAWHVGQTITATSLINGASSPTTMMVYYGTIGFNGG